MKTFVVLVLFGLALLGLGSALQCYTCDASGACDKPQSCISEDSCLSLTGYGGFKAKQCIKYADCDLVKLGLKFPGVPSITFSCCTSNLCNAASVSVASHSVLGILLSLALFWWCVL
ncbi:secreted Ly-6/uPAR domain-containing protein 2-like [Myxocyprinus asiaticus]|uniref:secreted Ly-6/uPAR domain-containing protein 2-like n=1 Tax=Myxocyprinus asiaticus TaxID=70543 RepID=UPI0022238DD2|nr:secreted Ly-6/uPAR domain-containing protein 2-like [Myxocyprinus asiaticus]XP_051503562.1 secreted Ly-6/uPAR domain-containing protein 2-like [Myxocyprinus asiaticus]